MEPFADEQHFARNRRHIFPRIQADEREIQFGKRVHARHAAEVQRHFARLQHARVRHGHAGELEREIGLDGGVHFGRAAVVNVPAAVRQLHGKDVVDRLALPFLVHFPVPMMIRDRVGNERGIHHQFADPVAFRAFARPAKNPATAGWRPPNRSQNPSAAGSPKATASAEPLIHFQSRAHFAKLRRGCKVLTCRRQRRPGKFRRGFDFFMDNLSNFANRISDHPFRNGTKL